MNITLKSILGRAETWPPEDQEELAQIALEIELRRKEPYRAGRNELQAIDEAVSDIAVHGFAEPAEVDALLKKHRG